MSKLQAKYIKLEEQARNEFGAMNFTQLEKWSGISLFGLGEVLTEEALNEIRDMFNDCDLWDKIVAIEEMNKIKE